MLLQVFEVLRSDDTQGLHHLTGIRGREVLRGQQIPRPVERPTLRLGRLTTHGTRAFVAVGDAVVEAELTMEIEALATGELRLLLEVEVLQRSVGGRDVRIGV